MSNKFQEQVSSARKSVQRLTDPVDTYFMEPVAMLMSRVFVKLNINPNFVTTLSLISGVTGGILFAFDGMLYRILGVVLVLLSGIFDTSDGQVARLSHKGSEKGRFFDGFCDIVVYGTLYAGITVNLMSKNIPFTDIKWGAWIWIVTVIISFIFHLRQAQTADYYRQVHMYLCPCKCKPELIRAKKVLSQYKDEKKFGFLKIGYGGYYLFTKMQENMTPKTQKLLDAIDANGSIPEGLKEDYDKPSLIITRLSNFMTFTLRSLPLFLFVLIGQPLLDFVYIIVVLGILCLVLEIEFEKLAKRMLKKYFNK